MLRTIKNLIAPSLRYKLLLLVLFPILIVVPAMAGIGIYWSGAFTYDQLLRKVNTDLSVTHDIFARLKKDYLAELQSLAESHAFQTAFAERDVPRLQNQLQALRGTSDFDFLHITDLKGRWILEDDSGTSTGSGKSTPLLRDVSNWGRAGVEVEIHDQVDLRREGMALAKRATLPLVDTPRAARSDREVEDRAMVIRTIAPVRDARGSLVALLDGGVLLNQNFDFVDTIRNLVYGPGSLPEEGVGTVTVFLDDVRISTNVRMKGGERALGTRVSQEVRDEVLGRGNTWVARAFVVNDWYISAYEPIIDGLGRRVGILYAGFLERPLRSAYYRAIGILLILLVLGTGFAALVAILGAKSIFKPIEAIASVVRATQAGEESRIGTLSSQDEIGELAREFDRMLGLLLQRNQEIQLAAMKLESKVEQRTRELKDRNARLQQTIDLLRETRRQLVESEKLAALGQLTAGVAHEINNPIAVMLGNIEVLRSELGDQVGPVNTEMQLIIEQIDRIRVIVDRLLKYSRPSSFSGNLERLNVGGVIDDTLLLVKHELVRKSVTVAVDHQATTRVAVDRRELQQVLVTLLINAVQASHQDGHIDVSTRNWSNLGLSIAVRDEGEGIAQEHLRRVFDPFFTTKKESGTGLGLSVSYGLIRRYGGDITVESEPGNGALFEIYLRKQPIMKDEEPPLKINERLSA